MTQLNQLLEEGIIDEILGRLKTGKEAEVWLVQHQGEILAAKIYKERQMRSFKNNAAYTEGRQIRNSRTARAIAKGSRFGQAAAEEAWKSTEADALYKLHAAGVRVPVPALFYEGILLMELVIDAEGHPAPRLIDAHLTPEVARAYYEDLRSQVIKMLCADVIHGDLSPYNVLASWQGPTVIDFPQVIGASHNNRAEFFFGRDLENLRAHLATIAPDLEASRFDRHEIWRAYVRRELAPDFVPTGKHRPEELKPRPPQQQRQPRQAKGQEPHRRGQNAPNAARKPGGGQKRAGPEVVYRGAPGGTAAQAPTNPGARPPDSPGSTGDTSGTPRRRRRRRR